MASVTSAAPAHVIVMTHAFNGVESAMKAVSGSAAAPGSPAVMVARAAAVAPAYGTLLVGPRASGATRRFHGHDSTTSLWKLHASLKKIHTRDKTHFSLFLHICKEIKTSFSRYVLFFPCCTQANRGQDRVENCFSIWAFPFFDRVVCKSVEIEAHAGQRPSSCLLPTSGLISLGRINHRGLASVSIYTWALSLFPLFFLLLYVKKLLEGFFVYIIDR